MWALVASSLVLGVPAVAAAAQHSTSNAVVSGTVTDTTGGALPSVQVELTGSDGIRRVAATDERGRYAFDTAPIGEARLLFRMPGFADSVQTASLTRIPLEVNAALHVLLTADVQVTAPAFRNLAELERPRESLAGVATAASEGVVTARQIRARPLLRAAEVIETVPGLIISQHSGDGKANQYYLRGFNLDHGTDFATSVAGVPVNMPTHAHGHGYADLGFIIPELVSGVQFRKGPYSADQGDFSAAGSARVNYALRLASPLVSVAAGGNGFRRVVTAGSPPAAGGHLLYAFELSDHDGPWRLPEQNRRVNGVLRFSRGDAARGTTLTALAYRARWNGTDQIPERAVAAGALSRFETVDESNGGFTGRYSLSSETHWGSPGRLTRATGYVLAYELDLFSNFTYFLEDPERGDQFEQRDRRLVSGGRLLHRRLASPAGLRVETSMGIDLRHDAIGSLGLYPTERRRRLGTTRDDRVHQTAGGAFVESQVHWTPRLRTITGLRGDVYRFAVDSRQPLNSGIAAAALVSPTATLVGGPWKGTELYLNTGRGFHSNDARGATIRVDSTTGDPADRATPLAPARGAEVGLRSVAIPRVHTTLAIWTLSLDSELVFAGDAGTTEAGPSSRRTGVEWSTFISPTAWMHFDVDVALSRARFTGGDSDGDRVPGSVPLVLAAGASLDGWRQLSGGIRWLYAGSRPLNEDGSVRFVSAGVLNTHAGYALSSRLTISAEVLNLLNSRSSDVEYLYTSRLPGEAPGGVTDVHSRRRVPRTVRFGFRVTL